MTENVKTLSRDSEAHLNLKVEIQNIRKGIPKQYNQLEFFDYLDDPDIDLMFSITTRSDGKTFNTLRGLLYLSIKLDFGTVIVVRHDQLRTPMLAQIQDVINTDDKLHEESFNYTINRDVIVCTYDEATPFYIVSLNDANDLKNYRAYLRHANIILYDEFLAVGAEYTNAEFNKWKVIYETMDGSVIPAMSYTNNRRKAIFLGNPVDFSSEFLAHYNLYQVMENQPINTIRKHKNIVIERRQNINAQITKNNRIFGDDGQELNTSVTGTFNFNRWQLVDPPADSLPIVVKLSDEYLYIYPADKPILSVKAYAEHYSFNTQLADNAKTSTYLNPRRFEKDNFDKKYTKELLQFANEFSKRYMLDQLPKLNIFKIINMADYDRKQSGIKPVDVETKKLERVQLEQTKKKIFESYFS